MCEFRILDANLNRAREGLRVVEDFVRFYRNLAPIQTQLKTFRQQLGEIEDCYRQQLLTARDAETDVGRDKDKSERFDINAMVWANMKRTQEALRSIEEILKVLGDKRAEQVKQMRYDVYTMEKEIFMELKNDTVGSSKAE